jgi:hypothetical protein
MRRTLHSILILILMAFLGVLSAQSQSSNLVVKFVNQELSLDPTDALWAQVASATIPLVPQQVTPPFGGGGVKEIQIRAVHNGRLIAFLTEWVDEAKNDELAQVDKFGDAVALQFPAELTQTANPFMGDAKGAVNIWQWQAAWQRDIDEGGIADVDRTYPPYASTVPYDVAVGKDAGNWRSQRVRLTPVENLVAQGFGTLTHQAQQGVLGRGIWRDNHWHVVFIRTLQSGILGDTPFVPGEKTSINFAVWQGANQDRGGRKSVTYAWHELQLEKTAGMVSTTSTTPTTSIPGSEKSAAGGVPAWLTVLIAGIAVLFGGVVGWLLRWMASPRA